MSSPRSMDGASPRTPSALRNELAAAKRAVEVLKAEKQNSDEKLDKLHAVLEKERNALRDVLSAARVKVDELEKVKKEQAEEIERLKRLLAERPDASAEPGYPNLSGEVSRLNTIVTGMENDLRKSTTTISERDFTIVELRNKPLQDASAAPGYPNLSGEVSRLNSIVTGLETDFGKSTTTISERDFTIVELRNKLQAGSGESSDLGRQISDLQRQLAEARNASAGAVGDETAEVARLNKRIEDLTQSLQSTQKTMREQVEAARTREQDMREQLTTQRTEMQAKIRELEAALRQATDSSKAHIMERLTREVKKYREEASLRIMNAMLRKHHTTMTACMFHQWVGITHCTLLSTNLIADCEYKLNRLRSDLTPGAGGPFGHTPLLHATHLATRNLGQLQRFDKWEQMSPRTGTGDGVSTLSPRSSGRKGCSPAGRTLEHNII